MTTIKATINEDLLPGVLIEVETENGKASWPLTVMFGVSADVDAEAIACLRPGLELITEKLSGPAPEDSFFDDVIRHLHFAQEHAQSQRAERNLPLLLCLVATA